MADEWTGYTGTEFTVTGLRPGTSHTVGVRAVGPNGEVSPSAMISFLTLPVAPALTLMSRSPTSIQAIIGAVTGAAGYELRHRVGDSGAWSAWAVVTRISTITGLAANTRYTVEARAVAANGVGRSEATAKQVTTMMVPAAPLVTGLFVADPVNVPGEEESDRFLSVHLNTAYGFNLADVEYSVAGKLAKRSAMFAVSSAKTGAVYSGTVRLQAFNWAIGDRMTARARVRRSSGSAWSAWSANNTWTAGGAAGCDVASLARIPVPCRRRGPRRYRRDCGGWPGLSRVLA